MKSFTFEQQIKHGEKRLVIAAWNVLNDKLMQNDRLANKLKYN